MGWEEGCKDSVGPKSWDLGILALPFSIARKVESYGCWSLLDHVPMVQIPVPNPILIFFWERYAINTILVDRPGLLRSIRIKGNWYATSTVSSVWIGIDWYDWHIVVQLVTSFEGLSRYCFAGIVLLVFETLLTTDYWEKESQILLISDVENGIISILLFKLYSLSSVDS